MAPSHSKLSGSGAVDLRKITKNIEKCFVWCIHNKPIVSLDASYTPNIPHHSYQEPSENQHSKNNIRFQNLEKDTNHRLYASYQPQTWQQTPNPQYCITH